VAIFGSLAFAVVALFFFDWWLPKVFVRLPTGPNRLLLTLEDQAGLPVTNATIRFSLRREMPIIPLPFGPTKWIVETRVSTSDAAGVVKLTWPNMDLRVPTVIISSASFPMSPPYVLPGAVVARTPDGRSTWDVGTNYTARILVDRIKHSAIVR